MSKDTLGPAYQTQWVSSTSELATLTGVRRGMKVTVGSTKTFDVIPAASKTADGVHVFDGIGVQYADAYAMGQTVNPGSIPVGAAGEIAVSNGTALDFTDSPSVASLSFGNGSATIGAVRLPNLAGIYARNAAGNGNIQLVFVDSSNSPNLGASGAVAKIAGASLPVSPSSDDVGKMLAVSAANTYALETPATLGLATTSNLQQLSFASGMYFDGTTGNALISFAQAASGTGTDVHIEAQNSTGGSSYGGSVYLSVGSAGPGVRPGNIYLDADNSGSVMCYASSFTVGAINVVTKPSFTYSEQNSIVQQTSSSTSPINFDFVGWNGDATLPDGEYNLSCVLGINGSSHKTITFTATYSKSGGTLLARDLTPGINPDSLLMSAGADGDNTLRVTVTPASSSSTVWTMRCTAMRT